MRGYFSETRTKLIFDRNVQNRFPEKNEDLNKKIFILQKYLFPRVEIDLFLSKKLFFFFFLININVVCIYLQTSTQLKYK